jgi:hypothetical protein
MAGMELCGRELRIDLAMERGASTPRTGYGYVWIVLKYSARIEMLFGKSGVIPNGRNVVWIVCLE